MGSADTIDVGIIGLDTSHSERFAAVIEARADATVAGVWDGGAVRDAEYVDSFCEEYRADRYREPEAMIGEVDAAMVLTVNWDHHRPIAETLLEAGLPTFLDKPIAGTVTDVEAIRVAAERSGAPVCGGSAVPYHPAVSEMRTDSGVHDLFVAGYNGPFYYGVHLADVTRLICGTNWVRIEPTDHTTTTTVSFEGGSTATVRFDGPTEDAAFGLLDVGSAVRTAYIDSSERALERMYEPFIESFVRAASGEPDHRGWLFDAATLILGVQAVLESGVTITPESPELYEVVEDGTAFTEEYRPLY
jgi:hypothetical protein